MGFNSGFKGLNHCVSFDLVRYEGKEIVRISSPEIVSSFHLKKRGRCTVANDILISVT